MPLKSTEKNSILVSFEIVDASKKTANEASKKLRSHRIWDEASDFVERCSLSDIRRHVLVAAGRKWNNWLRKADSGGLGQQSVCYGSLVRRNKERGHWPVLRKMGEQKWSQRKSAIGVQIF